MTSLKLLVPVTLLLMACSKAPEPTTTAPAPPAQPPPKTIAANTPFEGEIVLAVTDEMAAKLPSSITYEVKGSKVEYVPMATALRAVGDLDAQSVYAINDAEKTYEAIDFKPPASAKPEPDATIYKTGKTEKIAGLDCEDWSIAGPHEKVDVCAASGIAYIDVASDAKAGRAETPWAAALTRAKAFPLRVLVKDEKTGHEEYRAEATKAERKTIADTTFQVPTGYKTANLAHETKTASLP